MLAKFFLYLKANPGEVFNTIIKQEVENGNKDSPWVTLYDEID